MSPRRLKAYLFLISVVIIWGVAGPVIKFTLEGIDPLPFLIYRLFISTLLSAAFFANKIVHGKKFRQLRAHLPLAITYGVLAVPIGLGVLFLALNETTVLDLTLVSVMGPLLSLAGGHYFFKDHLTKKEKLGITIVAIGVLVNSFWPFFSGDSTLHLTGNLLLLLYLLSDSASVLLAKRSLRFKIKSANLTSLAFIVGFLVLLPIGLYIYGPVELINTISELPLKYHLGVWYMALLSGNLAYYLFVRAERTLKVSETVLFNYLQPLVAIPLAIFWLHESLTWHFVVGAIIIAVGLVIVEYKRYKKKNSMN